MKGNPAVATYLRNGRDEPHAFVRGSNDRLYDCFFDSRVGRWRWEDQGLPPATQVASSPAALASIQCDNPPEYFLHAFVIGGNGRLCENFWDGARWAWADHGSVANTSLIQDPALVTYRRPGWGEFLTDTRDRLYAYCGGSNNLLLRFAQGEANWRGCGALPVPPAVVGSEPTAISYGDSLYAYVVGSDSRLYANFSTDRLANDLMWRDLGQPSAVVTVTRNIRPALLRFGSEVFAYVRGSDGGLWAHRWIGWRRGDAGSWVNLGSPPGTRVLGPSSVVGFRHEGTDFMYAFVKGADERLYVHRWDGAGGTLWAGFGRPTTRGRDLRTAPAGGNTEVSSEPAALTARFEASNRIYCFVRGRDARLHVCFWNGSDGWFWTDLGTTADAPLRLSFDPASLRFGTVANGATARRTLTIENDSSAPLSASIQPSQPGSPFEWPGLNAVLAPGDRSVMAVDFTPFAAQDFSAIMAVTSNAEGNPHRIGLRGRGTGTIPV
jgi:hypothetical protein